MEKDKEYEKMVKANEEAIRNVQAQEAKKDAVQKLVLIIIAIPFSFYIFGKVLAWIADAPVVIGPFTFN